MVAKICTRFAAKGIECIKSLTPDCRTFEGLIAHSSVPQTSQAATDPEVAIDLNHQVLATIAEHNLHLPSTFPKAEPNDYCLAMSLQWLNEYVKVPDIMMAHTAVVRQIEATCAGARLARGLYLENKSKFTEAEQANFLFGIRATIARSYRLYFSQECKLKMPADEMCHHLERTLAAGEYLLSTDGLEAALIKKPSGELYLFSPSTGVVNLTQNKKYLLNLLVKHKVHLNENLFLYKVQNSVTTCERAEISSPQMLSQPELVFENSQARWGRAVFTWRGKTYRFVVDNIRHDIYNSDSPSVVRFKCALLTVGTPLTAVCRSLSHLAKVTIHTASLPYRAFQGREPFVNELVKIKLAVSNIFRTLGLATAGVATALYGVVKPYEGRRLYGHFERCLNRQTTRVDRKETFYLADCFIPLNFNVADKQNRDIQIAQLKKAVLWKEYLRGC